MSGWAPTNLAPNTEPQSDIQYSASGHQLSNCDLRGVIRWNQPASHASSVQQLSPDSADGSIRASTLCSSGASFDGGSTRGPSAGKMMVLLSERQQLYRHGGTWPAVSSAVEQGPNVPSPTAPGPPFGAGDATNLSLLSPFTAASVGSEDCLPQRGPFTRLPGSDSATAAAAVAPNTHPATFIVPVAGQWEPHGAEAAPYQVPRKMLSGSEASLAARCRSDGAVVESHSKLCVSTGPLYCPFLQHASRQQPVRQGPSHIQDHAVQPASYGSYRGPPQASATVSGVKEPQGQSGYGFEACRAASCPVNGVQDLSLVDGTRTTDVTLSAERAASAELPRVAAQLPEPITVQVASRSRRNGDDSSGKSRITRGAVGVFHPKLYLTGGECIECEGEIMSRGRFERLAGTATAKWHVSIKVLPSGMTLGRWLQQHGLPILQGRPRKRRADPDNDEVHTAEAEDESRGNRPVLHPRSNSLPEPPPKHALPPSYAHASAMQPPARDAIAQPLPSPRDPRPGGVGVGSGLAGSAGPTPHFALASFPPSRSVERTARPAASGSLAEDIRDETSYLLLEEVFHSRNIHPSTLQDAHPHSTNPLPDATTHMCHMTAAAGSGGASYGTSILSAQQAALHAPRADAYGAAGASAPSGRDDGSCVDGLDLRSVGVLRSMPSDCCSGPLSGPGGRAHMSTPSSSGVFALGSAATSGLTPALPGGNGSASAHPLPRGVSDGSGWMSEGDGAHLGAVWQSSAWGWAAAGQPPWPLQQQQQHYHRQHQGDARSVADAGPAQLRWQPNGSGAKVLETGPQVLAGGGRDRTLTAPGPDSPRAPGGYHRGPALSGRVAELPGCSRQMRVAEDEYFTGAGMHRHGSEGEAPWAVPMAWQRSNTVGTEVFTGGHPATTSSAVAAANHVEAGVRQPSTFGPPGVRALDGAAAAMSVEGGSSYAKTPWPVAATEYRGAGSSWPPLPRGIPCESVYGCLPAH